LHPHDGLYDIVDREGTLPNMAYSERSGGAICDKFGKGEHARPG
jgi:hypothetical protein